jgi:sulfopyruvate decarboxylase TPP-binding subunit
MLETEGFIKMLAEQGYSHFCVVPCSFAKNLINASINNAKTIEYVPCASEAVACSVAAGLKMVGKKPIVIVQSSGLTNMGSCITSLLVPYEIRFPIIVSWRTYNEGESEIQHQHLASRLPDLIDAYGYSHTILNKDSIEKAVSEINECETKNQICLLEKATFSKVVLDVEHQLDLSQYPKRSDYLKLLNKEFKGTDTIFIGTTGNTSREMYTFMPDTINFYMVGNMGGALSVGLGMAKAGKKVIVCGGDAEFVMHMGGLTTAGRYDNLDLSYLVFDNESNKSTGGQNTFQNHISYVDVIEYCGFSESKEIKDINNMKSYILHIKDTIGGVKFALLKSSYDDEVPRPSLNNILRNTNSISHVNYK